MFAVKQDRARPFEVAAGDTVTRAIGTEFNVDLRQSAVTVSVIDGAVRVATGKKGGVAMLAKGEAVEIPATQSQQPRTVAADLKRIDDWRTRRLEFTNTPLPQAVEEFNRYSTLRIVIGSPELESVRISGIFRIGDADGFLYSLREALGVQTHDSTNEVVLMRR